jgi:hypothetical protein
MQHVMSAARMDPKLIARHSDHAVLLGAAAPPCVISPAACDNFAATPDPLPEMVCAPDVLVIPTFVCIAR